MKIEINNLFELEAFLSQLTTQQKKTKPVIECQESADPKFTAEITEEPFMTHFRNGDIGMESELRAQYGDTFNRSEFEILEPAGTVIFRIS